MQDHPVLARVALGYCPMLDRQRNVVATRLTIFPERPDAAPDVPALLEALQEVWPPSDEAQPLKLTLRPLEPAAVSQRATAPAGGTATPVALNIAGEAMLSALLAASPPKHLMIEVPAFMATDPVHARALRDLHEAGNVLLIKGRPLTPLTPEVLAWFAHSIVEVADERRGIVPPAPGVRQVTTVQAGARTTAEIDLAFQRGAIAVLGWPFDDPEPRATGRATVPPDVKVVLELAVEREEPVSAGSHSQARPDHGLPADALHQLAGLRAERGGDQLPPRHHAAGLPAAQALAGAAAGRSKGVGARHLLYGAVRRGLLMEELGRTQGDAEMRGEMFICGVFSLLDRLLQQPFSELLQNVPVPERVQQALRGDGGPYAPYLELLRAIENEAVFDIREQSEALMLGPGDVNRAVLSALHAARQLDG
jgi:EAL and modified HD-GYP domain-containing signal transduction protein